MAKRNKKLTYRHHRCETCRFFWWSHSYYHGADGGCAREADMDKLPNEDIEPLGIDEDCPLWESKSVAVCGKHGIYFSEDGCEDCFIEELAENKD